MIKISSLNFHQSKHLVERAGLGAELNVIKSFIGQSLDSAVSQILSKPSGLAALPDLLKPSETVRIRKEYRKNGKRREVTKLYRKERDILKVWALENLLESENPLHERMTWFWHNHFTSAIEGVRFSSWMLQQDQTKRKHALGSFSDLLTAMTFDPAMLIYLDGKSNKKGQPNENFARELLELFTLGEGHYTETDIKEAARALTGWNVNNKKDKVVFQKKRHDSGVKKFMGQEGNFKAKDILTIVLKNNRTAEFIAEKLWFEFVSINSPESEVIKSWASTFRESNYDISKLLNTIFKSESFWNEKYKGTLIKSPIDLVAGSLRTFNLEDNDLKLNAFVRQLKLMGQDLYSPPNVKGWEGGKAWVDDDRLLRRESFLQRIMRGQTGANNKKKMRMQKDQNMQKSMISTMEKAKKGMDVGAYELPNLSEEQWVQWLLPIPAVTEINRKSKQAKLRAIVLDPAYQLK